jgi:hypothetical protein
VNDLDELLRRDREAGVPEPPDVRFTVAAVRRRLENSGARRAPAGATGVTGPGWLAVAAAVGTVGGGIGAVLFLGTHSAWLLLVPLAGLAVCPILLRKGADTP